MASDNLKNWKAEPTYAKVNSNTIMRGWSVPDLNFVLCDLGYKLDLEEQLAEEQERLEDAETAFDLLDNILETCEECELPVPDYVDSNYDSVARVYKKGKKQYFVFADENDEDLFEVRIQKEKIIWKSAQKYMKEEKKTQ